MKNACTMLVLMMLYAGIAQAENAAITDNIEARMAGKTPVKGLVKPASAHQETWINPDSPMAGNAPAAPVTAHKPTQEAKDNAAKPAENAPANAAITPSETPSARLDNATGTPKDSPADAIVWSTPQPADIPAKTGILSSDEGEYQYEALAPGADNTLLPEPIAPQHMENHKPMIAIVIDDMGVDRKHSARAIKLPAAVTLSYLPYAAQINEQTEAAKKEGHELLVHMPMQPDRKTADPGPEYLGTDMSPLELHDRVEKNLAAFDGYAGVNNHMGSKFTRDTEGLNVVMAVLEEKKLLFLDSRTTPGSIAEKAALAHHVPAAHRDVFIDNDETAEAVAKSLKQIERVARHAGAAIAIGHPKDVTLEALEAWLPKLEAQGFELVPLSTVVALRNAPKAEAVASVGAGAKAGMKPAAGAEKAGN